MSDEHGKESDQVEERRKTLTRLRAESAIAYPNSFRISEPIADLRREYDSKDAAALSEVARESAIAGRVLAIRSFGKGAFLSLMDQTGQLQIFLSKEELPDGQFEYFKKTVDIGDILGVVGRPFRTKTNELTLRAGKFTLLTKALRPLPEKWHGLTDVETRYRHRYVDLIVNPEVRETFILRSRIITSIRKFFSDRGFLEVETPMLHPLVGGAKARPFKTHHNALDLPLYLRIAPELYLKRLVVGGMDRVFEINRNFRNEGISVQHNPEFTMLEFYWAYHTYDDLIRLTEELMQSLVREVANSTQIVYQNQPLNFETPFRRVSYFDALATRLELPLEALFKRERLLSIIEQRKIRCSKDPAAMDATELQVELFEELVEPELIQPTFVTEYPTAISPLSRRNDTRPEIVDRFELFIYGREIANGFSELNDPDDQRDRFLAQQKAKAEGDLEASDFDEEYIRALEYGLPPTAGEGIGIDRLVMLLAGVPSIRDVILFPLLRPER